ELIDVDVRQRLLVDQLGLFEFVARLGGQDVLVCRARGHLQGTLLFLHELALGIGGALPGGGDFLVLVSAVDLLHVAALFRLLLVVDGVHGILFGGVAVVVALLDQPVRLREIGGDFLLLFARTVELFLRVGDAGALGRRNAGDQLIVD